MTGVVPAPAAGSPSSRPRDPDHSSLVAPLLRLVVAALAALGAGALLRASVPAPPVPPPPAPIRGEPALPSTTAAVASYRLEAVLDESAHVVRGHGTIAWKNTARTATAELYFHLYLNAFKDEHSLFLRAPGGRRRGLPEHFGGLTVKRLVARELAGVDLWPLAAPHSPEDPLDSTDIRVPLPRPVLPGDVLTLEIEFEAALPSLFARTGFVGGFHFVAQWFPKLARLEPDGTWAHFAFHPQAEFYADFGDYDVTLDVPVAMVVGAPGQLVSEERRGDRKRLRYTSPSVHDFAWSAWDGFRERTARLGSVDVRVLFPPGQEQNTEQALEALRFALPDLERRYGAYPYPTLTVVHPPPGADAAGGMEYPGLITTGAPWFAPFVSRAIELVTVHELSHQWFQGLCASNEHALPVLDEGLATWAETVTLERQFGATSAIHLPGLAVSAEALRRALAAAHVHDDAVVQPAPEFASFGSIGALVYAKTGATLRTLANVYGEERVERAVGAYARRHRFGHPGWEDLVAAIQEHVGAEAATTLRLALETPGWVNYLAERPTCQAAPSGEQECTVLVRRHGTLTLPVEIDLVLASGARERRHWDGRGPQARLDHAGPDRLVGVVVDPSVQIVLDSDLLDNAASVRAASTLRTTALASLAAQALLTAVGP